MSTFRLFEKPLIIRAIGTLIYGAIFIWLVVNGGIPLVIGLLILAAIASFEYYRLATYTGHHPSQIIGIIAAVSFILSAYLKFEIFSHTLTFVIIFTIVGDRVNELLRQKSLRGQERNAFVDWSITLVGTIYSGGLLAHAYLIRELPNGMNLLLIVVIGAAACDTFAYLIGKSIGRHKFFPHISPKKTLEGAIGGFLLCILAVLLSVHALKTGINIGLSLVLGIIIGGLVIFGDIVESMFKRTAGVKDAGSLIPEQGGLLDVIDGFLFAVAGAYYFYLVFL